MIYGKLEDGAELLYTEYDDLNEEDISKMITPKSRLAAFQVHDPSTPDLRDKTFPAGADNGE